MKETIEKYPRQPDADYVFEVIGIPEKITIPSGHVMRDWVFRYEGNREFKVRLFPNAYMPIVLAIGGVEVSKGKVDWDDEQVDGKVFSCSLKTVVSESKGKTYENYVFENCQPAGQTKVPF